MTDKPTPTDAELKAMWRIHAADIGGILDFARAVLAKWGQPAQAAEPVAWLDPWTGTKVTTDYDAYGKHGIPLVRQKPVAREPLTDEQWQRITDLTGGRILTQAVKDEIERVIGTKGGQHG